MIRLFSIGVMILMITITCLCNELSANEDWALTFYGGRLSVNNLGETLTLKADYENSYLGVLALSRKIGSFMRFIDFELEGQITHHFGDQNHFETNGLFAVRWLPFFRNKHFDTSLAIGAGISYAFKTPKLEAIDQSNTPKTLGYLMLELSLTTDENADWCFVMRIHHRSGANGLFGGRLDASNAWCFGVKYRF
ncbi:MAG: hypothetical protein JW786_04710 [Desulfobacterales bacterium]|nr:hypothetical protein [Desulfobacterales bacterium]